MSESRYSRGLLALILSLTGGAAYIGCAHSNVVSDVKNAVSDAARDLASVYGESETPPQAPVAGDAQSQKLHEVLSAEAQEAGGKVHFVEKLKVEEVADIWHLSEGSDIYPLKWFLHIKSATSNQPGTRLAEKLDEKFGVIPETDKFAATHAYPLKWIGLSVAWSDMPPQERDIKLPAGQTVNEMEMVKSLDNNRSAVAMMGTNCSFCHTGQIQFGDKRRLIEGAPNMIHMRAFFQDLVGSTVKTMLTEEDLAKFLAETNVKGDIPKTAREFVAEFKHELKLDTWGVWAKKLFADNVLANLDAALGTSIKATKEEAARKDLLFQNRAIIAKYLTRLLALTHDLKEATPEQQERMKWLAALLGFDPSIPSTPEGFARTDAFGRISNWVARKEHPIPLTATVSLPPMWNLQYKAIFHWNGNTNSVVMRNIGQSFGLGSILVNPNAKDASRFETTSNLHNLQKIEGLLYKIPAPRWTDYVAEVDLEKAIQGCNVFQKTCVGCHGGVPGRVGPNHDLVMNWVLPLKEIGTDGTYPRNQATPVGKTPFREALFGFTGTLRTEYYKKYGISAEEQKHWERRELRGTEVFRDTFLGGQTFPEQVDYMANVKPDDGFVAPFLAGAWATAPYLHNGSVPTVWDLLTPQAKRPKIFFVGSRKYDTKKLGYESGMGILPVKDENDQRALKIKANTGVSLEDARLLAACELNPMYCFRSYSKGTNTVGNSNQGHSGEKFGTNLPDGDKWALIEFLKILRPHTEFSTEAAPIYTVTPQGCSLVQ